MAAATAKYQLQQKDETMANLRRHGNGPFHLELRYADHKFQRSLRTKDKVEAKRLLSIVQQTVEYLDRGVLVLPPGSSTDELWRFLISGGKIAPTPEPAILHSRCFADVCDDYLDSFAEGSKEASTLKTERHHLSHLKRLVGRRVQIASIKCETLEDYVHRRQKEKGIRGRRVAPSTIGKELSTFGLVWQFAVRRGWARGENPAARIPKPRGNQKPAFMTFEEIERRANRGGLSDAEVADLWDALFLRENEIAQLLVHVRTKAPAVRSAPYIYPAIAFVAYTGARRSEMFRTLIDDVNGRVILREKKRSQEYCVTFRELPLHPQLSEILDDWLNVHPGGQFLFCKRSGKPLEDKTARDAFDAVLRHSSWHMLRGYHVLRHSFASNLARRGVDQRVIDEFMGHQTEEMRRRYRHLFPEDTARALSVLDYSIADLPSAT